jgi:phosphotriesterase-related protein
MTCGESFIDLLPLSIVLSYVVFHILDWGRAVSGVHSVTGWVQDTDLGFTLVHEHVAASSAGILRSWPGLSGGREDLVRAAVAALADVAALGVRTIVDCTTFDLGRDGQLLAEVSRASGVAIIACSGLWLDPPVTVRARTAGQLADWFLHDLLEGVDGTRVRAGAIKIATEEAIGPDQEKIIQAAGIAAVQTSAPIITHTAARHRGGEAQAALLESFGVDPHRVAIGHSDDSDDLGYLTGLASRGYWISMDRLPHGRLPEYGGQTVQDRIEMIVKLIESGFAGQVLLSHDEPIWAGLLTDQDQERHRRSNPDGLAFISKVVIPGLEKLGIPAEVISAIIVDNPRRWLSGG